MLRNVIFETEKILELSETGTVGLDDNVMVDFRFWSGGRSGRLNFVACLASHR